MVSVVEELKGKLAELEGRLEEIKAEAQVSEAQKAAFETVIRVFDPGATSASADIARMTTTTTPRMAMYMATDVIQPFISAASLPRIPHLCGCDRRKRVSSGRGEQCSVVPNVLIIVRYQESPAGWQRKVWQHRSTTLLQVADVKRLEELRVRRRLFSSPDEPAARSALGWMSQAIQRALAAQPTVGDAELANAVGRREHSAVASTHFHLSTIHLFHSTRSTHNRGPLGHRSSHFWMAQFRRTRNLRACWIGRGPLCGICYLIPEFSSSTGSWILLYGSKLLLLLARQ